MYIVQNCSLYRKTKISWRENNIEHSSWRNN